MILAWQVTDAVTRNWALVGIALTIVTLVVIPALVIGRYVRIALNIMRTTRPPLTRAPLDFERLRGEPIEFPASDGLPLGGMLIRAPHDQSRRGMIVFAHEFCADMHSCARYCRPLLDAGYDIFTFDFRGHGQVECEAGYTPRQWISDRELHDMRGAVATALQWLEEQGLPAELGLFGISRGACAAILAAAEFPQVRALVADGAYSSDTSIEYFMKRWAYLFAKVRVLYENHPPAFWRFMRRIILWLANRQCGCTYLSVRKCMMRMTPRPMLFIHGERDSYLPVEQSRRLYAQAGQPKYLWIAPGAKHNQAVVCQPDFYARLTTAFFDRHLARPCRAEPRPQPAPAASRERPAIGAGSAKSPR